MLNPASTHVAKQVRVTTVAEYIGTMEVTQCQQGPHIFSNLICVLAAELHIVTLREKSLFVRNTVHASPCTESICNVCSWNNNEPKTLLLPRTLLIPPEFLITSEETEVVKQFTNFDTSCLDSGGIKRCS